MFNANDCKSFIQISSTAGKKTIIFLLLKKITVLGYISPLTNIFNFDSKLRIKHTSANKMLSMDCKMQVRGECDRTTSRIHEGFLLALIEDI